jgi:hypothetical protein
VSVKGGSYARFRRALSTGNPLLVRAAAAELPRVELEDALSICLVLLQGDPARYPAAAARWHGRLSLERRLALDESELAISALGALRGAGADAAAAALAELCRRHEMPRAARSVEEWAAGRA